jgi:acyl carrier protein
MDASAIKTRVRQFITTTFYVPDPSEVTDTVSFLETGIVDSTGVLEIIGFLQSEFGVTVEDHEILPDNLDSLLSIAAYVERKTIGGVASS